MNPMVLPLTYISPGQSAQVVWLAGEPDMARRLDQLGFSPGETVRCVLTKPRGGMSAYLARSAVIALRESDAAVIFVRTDGAGTPPPARHIVS